jgi:serine protease
MTRHNIGPARLATRACVLVLWLASVVGGSAAADETASVPADSGARIIVKFRPRVPAASAGEAKPDAAPAESALALAARQGVALRQSRRHAANLQQLQKDPQSAGGSATAALARLRADSAVEYAELDVRRHVSSLPNDPLYPQQWYLQSTSVAPSAIDAEDAWDLSTGSAGIVIADIDTGVLFDHPDLKRTSAGGRILPGYDFISDPTEANDGDGRDPDASDPGDWVTDAETRTQAFNGCDTSPSSWHGTRVAGILGAETDNSDGIAGETWNAWILPVRALGKCGGYDSDILPAMLWAAGIHVDGVPDNPYPAKIINLSIGAPGDCPSAYQDVIDQLSARGVLVVVAAGNEGGPVDAPADCSGVAAVTGLRQAGTKVGFSNLGPEITLGAPGGNCVNTSPGSACLYPIDTTSDTGTTTPADYSYTDQTDYSVGTSFSAPIVSAIAALMLSVDGNLSPAQLIARLKEGTLPFPAAVDSSVPECRVPTGPNDLQIAECRCTTSTCGAGMANALGSVRAALRPIAAVAVPASVSPGQDIELSAAGSGAACGHSIAAYRWSVVDDGGSGTGVSSPDTAQTSVTAPASGSLTVRVTVTDDAGLEDSADVTIQANSAVTDAPATAGSTACLAAISSSPPDSSAPPPSSPPASQPTGTTPKPTASSGGGGGGAADPLALLGMLVLLLGRRARKERLD